jgi:benzylsuccinate CoA-transferase BbsF subunit
MGNSGPWRDYVGFGPTVQAFSGITYLTSFPGKPPLGLGTSYADHIAGLIACLALLSALEYRRKTGEGQYIDVSQVEAMAGLLGDAILDYTVRGEEVEPVGNSSTEAAPHGVYRCQGDDRWCAIAVFTDEEWQGFKRALGNPPWAEDKRFATLAGRLKHSEELDRLVEDWTKERTAEEAMALLQRQGVAAGVVQDASDLAEDPQLKERGFFIELDHPELGKTISDAVPIRLSDTPARYTRAAPIQGQDNNYVYRELLGMSEDEIDKLREQGVI